jgi:hypothetical protein
MSMPDPREHRSEIHLLLLLQWFTSTRPQPIPASYALRHIEEPGQMWTYHGACFKKCLAQPPDFPEEFQPAHF